MYICLNLPFYTSKLTEIAQSVKTLYRVEEEGRKRDLEGLTGFFLCSFQMREKDMIKTLITNLICCLCPAWGCSPCGTGPTAGDTSPRGCWRRRVVLCDTQTGSLASTTAKPRVTCASNSDCPLCDSSIFIYSALSA